MSVSNDEEFDLFISYQWDIKPDIRNLQEKLLSADPANRLKIWRDDDRLEINSLGLTDQLAKGIKKSKIFLCCLTHKYNKSKNCRMEIEYANRLNKRILVLFIDKLDFNKDLDGIGLIIASLLAINCYKHPGTWVKHDFEVINNSIKENLKVKNTLNTFVFMLCNWPLLSFTYFLYI